MGSDGASRLIPRARAPRTQDLLVPALGGWSARWTRAVKASPAARPLEKMRWMVCRVPVAVQSATGDDARSLRLPGHLPYGTGGEICRVKGGRRAQWGQPRRLAR